MIVFFLCADGSVYVREVFNNYYTSIHLLFPEHDSGSASFYMLRQPHTLIQFNSARILRAACCLRHSFMWPAETLKWEYVLFSFPWQSLEVECRNNFENLWGCLFVDTCYYSTSLIRVLK
jgi:hypothetical protein